MSPLPVPHVRAALIGTGFGGLGVALRLLRDGETSLVLFERAGAVGGVWRDNVYPGAACDVESHLYALDAAPNAEWSRRFSRQPEILTYLGAVAREHGLAEHVRFGHDVLAAVWDAAAARWQIATTGGDYTADVLVSASGSLAEPRLPDLPGLDRFTGAVVHTSRWDARVDLAGKRVAVVGTGASAVQVVPEVQRVASHLTLFQRTPPHVLPRRDRPLGPLQNPVLRAARRAYLFAQQEVLALVLRHPRAAALAGALPRRHLARHIPDADLRRRLTPADRFGCRRVLLSDDYYPALAQPNVTVTGAAVAVRPEGLVDADGAVHEADVLVFATGFHVHDLPIAGRITGRAGRTLAAVWGASPRAHVGTTVAGFPNLFLVQGPNASPGHSSVVLAIEAQAEHIAGALRHLRATGAVAVEPRADAQAAFVAEVDRMSAGTVWTSGCQSWYLDGTGRNAAVWPGTVRAFRRRVERFRVAEYHVRYAGEPVRPERRRMRRASARAVAQAAGRAVRRRGTATVRVR